MQMTGRGHKKSNRASLVKALQQDAETTLSSSTAKTATDDKNHCPVYLKEEYLFSRAEFFLSPFMTRLESQQQSKILIWIL